MREVKGILKHLDLIYIVFVIAAIIFDYVISSITLDAIVYILILLGFAISLLPSKTSVKDERMLYIKHIAGYSAFLLTALVILIFSLLYAFFELKMDPSVLLRTITMSMFFVFTLINAIGKRII